MSTKTKKTITILGIVLFVIAASLVIAAIVLFTTQKKEPQHAFGNVVSYDGELYYWKYSNDSFSSEEASNAHYEYRVDTTNQLVCRHENGEESVIVFENGAENICVVGDRIFYQVFLSEPYNLYRTDEMYRIKSCSLKGEDVKEYGDGILLGLIENDNYLITQFKDEGICSIDTQTWDKTVISEDSYLICTYDSVICYRSNNDESGLNEEFTIHSVSGDGQNVKDLYTEKVSTLPIVIQKKKDSDPVLRGHFEINVPFIYNNRLFYLLDFISGTFTQAHFVDRITSIDLNTGEATEILGSVEWQMGSYFNIDINSEDESVIAYNDYLSNLDHRNIIDENNFSVFSDAKTIDYEEEKDLLKVDYYVKIEDKEYIFLTSGKYTRLNGMYSMFLFEKCALFEKDINTGACNMIYSSEDPNNYTDLAERGPIPLKAGDVVDFGDFLFSVPDTSKETFAYKKLNDSAFFYFKGTQKQKDDENISDNWGINFSLSIVDIPESVEQPSFDNGVYSSYNLAKLTRDGDEKLIEAKHLALINGAVNEDDQEYLIDCIELIRTGLKAKPDTEIEPLDYSNLDDTAWYTIADDGTVLNFNIYDVSADIISATMFIEGTANPEKITIRMYGNKGYLKWERLNESHMMLNEYFDDNNISGFGSLECIDNDRLSITMIPYNNPEYQILDGLTFVSVYVPREEETRYISGKIKESCEYFEISLPDWWDGLYTCEKTSGSLSFYHVNSKEEKGYGGHGGHLFTLTIEETANYYAESWWWQVAIRRITMDKKEEFICLHTPEDAPYQVAAAYTEQYDAMYKTIDAIIETLKPTVPNAKLTKFDIGFTSKKYTGTNESGDRFELLLTYETINSASGKLIFYPSSGKKSITFDANHQITDGQYTFSYSNYDPNAPVHPYGNGDIEVDGTTIRLILTDVSGNTPLDDGGIITLTAVTG